MLTNKIYTISRFCIATACIILGVSEFISPRYVNPTIVSIIGPIIPESFAVIALVELIGGFFLFVKYRTHVALPILIGGRILATLFFADHLLPVVNNIAVIGGLLLLVDNSGKSLLEVMESNIGNLPNYKLYKFID